MCLWTKLFPENKVILWLKNEKMTEEKKVGNSFYLLES